MDWTDELQVSDKSSLWSAFTKATPGDLLEIEGSIRRPLPEDFRSFYQRIGYGPWPNRRGGIYSPRDIIATIAAPIYFALGSLFPGAEWATEAQHRELWLSRGTTNPDPHKFTEQALTFHGMSLLDLLQIGTDGSGGYQMLNLSDSSPIKYLVVYESTEIDMPSPSFRAGIHAITDWLTR
jgi:hypothetical protein